MGLIKLRVNTLSLLRSITTATITMQLLKRGIRACFIEGATALDSANCEFVAEAYTLRFVPMREDLSKPEILSDPNYAPRAAIEKISPGQALVIDCRGDRRAGALGDILTLRMKKRGIEAVVTDGPVRDSAALIKIGLPVFCSGKAAPASLNQHFGADQQCAIACGGATVFPGDIMIGDSDGVVVLPRALADQVAIDGREQEDLEVFLKGRIEKGLPIQGTYPPNKKTLDKYKSWKTKR